MKKDDIEFWSTISNTIMVEAQEAVRPLVGTEKASKVVKMGADGTPTKFIDLVAEEKVVEVLEDSERPVTLISEEIGEFKIGKGPSEAVFVVDPLDGTRNAIKNIPAYGISIAVQILLVHLIMLKYRENSQSVTLKLVLLKTLLLMTSTMPKREWVLGLTGKKSSHQREEMFQDRQLELIYTGQICPR